jgi:hypothetical protein
MENTYLRFTDTIEEDMSRGYSFLTLPSLKKPKKLKGLCAIKFDMIIFDESTREYREKTNSEIMDSIMRQKERFHYIDCETAVIIEGDYLEDNVNGEGVVIKAKKVIKKLYI